MKLLCVGPVKWSAMYGIEGQRSKVWFTIELFLSLVTSWVFFWVFFWGVSAVEKFWRPREVGVNNQSLKPQRILLQ
jgi:hypothetical protein